MKRTEPTQRQRAAAEALRERCARSTAYLLDGEHLERPTNVGSGTLVITPSGAVVILTGAHLFERDALGSDRLRIGFYQSPASAAFAPSIVRHPAADVDVAIVAVPPEIESAARDAAVPFEAVTTLPDDAEFDEMLIVAGYPSAQITAEVDHARGRATSGSRPSATWPTCGTSRGTALGATSWSGTRWSARRTRAVRSSRSPTRRA